MCAELASKCLFLKLLFRVVCKPCLLVRLEVTQARGVTTPVVLRTSTPRRKVSLGPPFFFPLVAMF